MVELKENLLFVSSCFSTYLDPAINPPILEAVKAMITTTPSVQKSNSGGWQSPSVYAPEYDNWHTSQLFDNFIIPAAKRIRDAWELPCDMDKLAYWYNANPKYTYNREHTHHNSFLSGAYYIKVPKNSGNIVFTRSSIESERMHFITDRLQQTGTDVNNSRLWNHYSYVPKEGMLLLFPGHLAHYVESNLTTDKDDIRVSLSFNFF